MSRGLLFYRTQRVIASYVGLGPIPPWVRCCTKMSRHLIRSQSNCSVTHQFWVMAEL